MKHLSLKNITALFLVFILIVLLFACLNDHRQIKRLIARIANWDIYLNPDNSCYQCNILFQDGLSAHESAYQYEGIKPPKDFDALNRMIDKRTLRVIESSEKYLVEPMDASRPVLLPKGITFLNRLANEYRALCDRENIEYIPFRITSATRTQKSVKELRKTNGNAIENSAHLRGKTIDITYITSKKHVKQKRLFVQALASLKEKGLCYVKFEVQKKCLHITCR